MGMASMTAVTLKQTGIVKHLPDPPSDHFDSDRVNSSETAYQLGVPDGTLSLASLAANIPLAAFGGADRVQTLSLIPLGAAVKAGLEALVTGWFFYSDARERKEMVRVLYLLGALANFGIFAMTVSEA